MMFVDFFAHHSRESPSRSSFPPFDRLRAGRPAAERESSSWLFGFTRAKRWCREVSSASAAAELLLFARAKRSNQEKTRPEIAPSLRERTDPPARRRDLRDARAEAKSKGSHAAALGSPLPSMAPSSAAGLGGKARMFERRDARVRAGPRPASSAGHRTKSGARVGSPSLWLLSLGDARESSSAAAEADETSRHTRVMREQPKARRWVPAFAGTTRMNISVANAK